MSGVAKKRTYPKSPTVDSIKLIKLQDANYAVEKNSPKKETDAKDAPEPVLGTEKKESDSKVTPPTEETPPEWIISTPTLNLFDNLPYMNENGMNGQEIPLEIKIESVTSLNPEYSVDTQVPNKRQSLRNFNRIKASTAAPLTPVSQSSSSDEPKNGINNKPQFVKLKMDYNKISGNSTTTETMKERRKTLIAIYADDGTRYFPCHRCSNAFLRKSLLYKHIVAKHPDFLVCKLCCSLFKRKTTKSLESHMKSHNVRQKDQTKQCQYCLFWFTPKCYPTHLNVHSSLKKFVCRVCKFKFRRVDGMKSHMQLCHGLDQ